MNGCKPEIHSRREWSDPEALGKKESSGKRGTGKAHTDNRPIWSMSYKVK